MIFPIYHIKRKLLTTVIAPHGITDILHATQNNSTKQLLSINSLCVVSSFGLSQNDVTILGLNVFFLASSLVHFRHDFPIIFRDGNQELQKYICSLALILSFIENYNLFFWYMTFIHVPNHYYLNREVIKQKLGMNLSFILAFTLLFSFLGEQYIVFDSMLFPLYKGLVVAHIIYQEMCVHSSFTH